MVKPGQMTTWFSGRRRVVAVVLIGWIALVVTGAGRKSDATGWFGIPNLQSALLAIVGLLMLRGLVMLPFMMGRRHGPLTSRPTQSLRALVLVAAIIVLLAFVFGPDEFGQDPVEEEPAQTNFTTETVTIDERDDGAIVWLLLTCVAAGAVLLWSRRRLATELADSGTGQESTLESELAPAIDLAAELLLPGGDPRKSVLAAYASLERSLADQGRGRDPSETPTEHLARVLVSVPIVAGPAVRLGELYELARFSDYAITKDDQHLAALALDRARRNLAGLAGNAK
jgi:hypothetical protein